MERYILRFKTTSILIILLKIHPVRKANNHHQILFHPSSLGQEIPLYPSGFSGISLTSTVAFAFSIKSFRFCSSYLALSFNFSSIFSGCHFAWRYVFFTSCLSFPETLSFSKISTASENALPTLSVSSKRGNQPLLSINH